MSLRNCQVCHGSSGKYCSGCGGEQNYVLFAEIIDEKDRATESVQYG